MLVDSRGEDIVYTSLFSGILGNYLRGSVMRAGLDPDKLPEADKTKMNFGSGGASELKAWRDIWSAGQSVSGIHDVEAVGALDRRDGARVRRGARESQRSANCGWRVIAWPHASKRRPIAAPRCREAWPASTWCPAMNRCWSARRRTRFARAARAARLRRSHGFFHRPQFRLGRIAARQPVAVAVRRAAAVRAAHAERQAGQGRAAAGGMRRRSRRPMSCA